MPRRLPAPPGPSLPTSPLGAPPAPPDPSQALARLFGLSRARRGGSPLPRRAPAAAPIGRAVRAAPAMQAAHAAQQVRRLQRAQTQAAQQAQRTPAARQQRAQQQQQQTSQAVAQAARGAGQIRQMEQGRRTRTLAQTPPLGITRPLAPRAAPPTQRLEPRAAPPTRPLPPERAAPTAPAAKPAAPPRQRAPVLILQPPTRVTSKPGHLLGPAYHAPEEPQPEPYRGLGWSGPLQSVYPQPDEPPAGKKPARTPRGKGKEPAEARPVPPATLAEQRAALDAQEEAGAQEEAPERPQSLGEALRRLAAHYRARIRRTHTPAQRAAVDRAMRARVEGWARIDEQLRAMREPPPDQTPDQKGAGS